MKYYIERPKSSHKNIRKKNKHARMVFKDHVIFSYLMTHLDYLRELKRPGYGLFAYVKHIDNSVEIRPVKITQIEYRDSLYDADVWADDSLYGYISDNIDVALEMKVSRDTIAFFREWLDVESIQK